MRDRSRTTLRANCRAIKAVLQPTEGQAHDGRSAVDMLGGLQTGRILIADRDGAGNRRGIAFKPNHAWIDAHKDGFPIGH